MKVPSPLVGEGKHSSPRYRSEMGEGSLGLRYLSAYALARTMTVINFDTNATPEAAISLFRVAIEMPVDKGAMCLAYAIGRHHLDGPSLGVARQKEKPVTRQRQTR